MGNADDVSKQLFEVVTDRAQELMINIQAELIDQTPVDTGWAKNNWLPSIGKSIDKPVGSPEDVDTEAVTHGITVFGSWDLTQPAYIRNNVPYIEKLNEGHSAHAPAGFVDKIIIEEVHKHKKKT